MARRTKSSPKPDLIIAGLFSLLFVLPAATARSVIACITFLFILAGALGLFLYRQARRQRRALQAVQLADIDSMSGVDFENYVAAIFRGQGYRVNTTPVSGDFGVDLIIVKDGERTAVQLKRYGKPVNLKAVQEVVAGMKMTQYRATKSMVVTNNTFAASAVALAAIHDCQLIDRLKLGEWIAEFSKQPTAS